MPVEDLPEPVKKYVMAKVRSDKEQRVNKLNVTELVGCLRKAWYRRKFGEEMSLQQAWYFYRGLLFDEDLTCRFPQNQGRITHRIKGTPIIITGRYDFIYEDSVCDLKTVDGLYYVNKEGAKTEHSEQVRFYMALEGRNKGRIYYISMNDCSVFEFEQTVEEADEIVEEMEKRARTLYDALVFESPPEREEGYDKQYWECRYCSHSERCYGEKSEGNE